MLNDVNKAELAEINVIGETLNAKKHVILSGI